MSTCVYTRVSQNFEFDNIMILHVI